MNTLRISALAILFFLSNMYAMDLPNTVTIVSGDGARFTLDQKTYSVSPTLLNMARECPDQEEEFNFREFAANDLNNIQNLLVILSNLEQNHWSNIKKLQEEFIILSQKSIQELSRLINIMSFLDVQPLVKFITCLIGQKLAGWIPNEAFDRIINTLKINDELRNHILDEYDIKPTTA